MIFLRYRWHTGFVAWLVQRLTGVLLTLYLFAHLYVLSHLREPAEFERLMELTHNPFAKLMELALMGVVAAHALNGARVMALELGAPTRLQKPLFWAAAAGLAAVLAMGAIALFSTVGAHGGMT